MKNNTLNKFQFRLFVIHTKIVPILIAIIHFTNTITSYLNISEIPLNYIGSISVIPIIYLYHASYILRLCSYYRMFLHYTILITCINVYDYYIGIPINSLELLMLIVMITILTMLVIIYIKFRK